MRIISHIVRFGAGGAIVLIAASVSAQCPDAIQRSIAAGQHEQARIAAQAAAAKAPNDDAALHCLGQLLLDEDKAGDAVALFEKAIAANPRRAVHHYGLARAISANSANVGMLEQASAAGRVKAEYEKAIELDPAFVDARRGLVTFLAQVPAVLGGDMDKAREQAAAILKLNPVRGHIAYGYIAERGEDFAGAAKEYQAATNGAPPDSAVYARLSLGRIYVSKLQDFDRGQQELESWLAKPPKDATPANLSSAHYYLGFVHQQRHRLDQARAEFQAALSANPANENARKALAALK